MYLDFFSVFDPQARRKPKLRAWGLSFMPLAYHHVFSPQACHAASAGLGVELFGILEFWPFFNPPACHLASAGWGVETHVLSFLGSAAPRSAAPFWRTWGLPSRYLDYQHAINPQACRSV